MSCVNALNGLLLFLHIIRGDKSYEVRGVNALNGLLLFLRGRKHGNEKQNKVSTPSTGFSYFYGTLSHPA